MGNDDSETVDGNQDDMDQALLRRLDDAWSALEDGDIAAARRAAREVLVAAPEAPDALLLEAACLREEGEHAGAIEALGRASKADPEWCTPVLWQAELLAMDPATIDEAQRCAARALDLAEEEDEYLNAVALKAGLEIEAGQIDKAKRTLRDLPAADATLGDAVLALEIADLHLAVGDAEEARARLRTLTAAEPELSDAWHALGIASEALGDEEGMRAAWRRTRELDVASDEAREEAGGGSGVEPDGRPRLDDKGVAALAEEALAELPERARQLLVNVPIIVADRPARDDVDAGLDPRMLGMFAGTPYPEAGAMGGQPGLTQILLFRRNLERIAGNEEELREEIRTTLLHETGHFFGMDEDDLEKVGLD